jgi:DNA-directed RNA polymerase sigma subunit (sigma70/sigma32)
MSAMNQEKAIKAGTERTERNAKIIEYRKAHPGASCEAIGKIFKISKQRVSQILIRAKREGVNGSL